MRLNFHSLAAELALWPVVSTASTFTECPLQLRLWGAFKLCVFFHYDTVNWSCHLMQCEPGMIPYDDTLVWNICLGGKCSAIASLISRIVMAMFSLYTFLLSKERKTRPDSIKYLLDNLKESSAKQYSGAFSTNIKFYLLKCLCPSRTSWSCPQKKIKSKVKS